MFGVFGQAGWVRGAKPPLAGAKLARVDEEEEEAVLQRLSALRESLPHRHRAGVAEKVLGPGTGIAYIQGPNVKCASRGGVTVLFCGQLEPPKKGEHVPAWGQDPLECASSWQTEAELAARGRAAVWDDAKRVLDVYKRAHWGGLQGPDLWEGKGGYACPAKHHGAGPRAAARLLGGLRGRFAFLVWDSVHCRLVAARDHQAQEAIFWGAPTFGEGLLFSTDRALVEEEAADADQFPPGTFFCLTPDDGTDGTGIMSSFELASPGPDDGRAGSSEEGECGTDDLDDTSGAASGEGDDNLEWESGGAPMTLRKRRGSALKETRLGALRRTAADAMSDEESSSEEDRASTCGLPPPPIAPRSGSTLRPAAPPSATPKEAAPAAAGKPPRNPKTEAPALRVVLKRQEKPAPPVFPRTAVRRVVTSVMKRVASTEGMCRASSGENLAALAGAQVTAK
ncbi:hypothetical protein KFL_005480020 [Klebsormidium nitens]|uniref:DUF3700 domain-containing protein n=1 Tax=Klebsormidium nitens TaxID=105231 RepID=A0A1Y1INH1_KLENI|nr:hypothetical protein KFL_005480020 [Klebsormidium nitens]|eukprot:GAQ89658.1 hypothetical protein KFL_005480020 [Klebsormidium nitens]